MTRTLLTGADLVLPDRIAANHTLVIEDGRIVEMSSGLRTVASGEHRMDLSGHVIVPGFIDVHVHGVLGRDVQDGDGAIAAIARDMPRFGVTAFCPTTVACSPETLATVLAEVQRLRATPEPGAARSFLYLLIPWFDVAAEIQYAYSVCLPELPVGRNELFVPELRQPRDWAADRRWTC